MDLKFVGRWELTNEEEDRDRDIVRSAGGDIVPFQLNPILLYNHRNPGIGRVEKIAREGNSWFGDVYIDTGNAEGKEYARRVSVGTLNMVSIRFIPKKWAEREKGGYEFLEWELIEVSLVDIPSNRMTSQKSWSDNGGIIKNFNKTEKMNLLSIINKWLGSTVDEKSSEADIEKAFQDALKADAKVTKALDVYQTNIEKRLKETVDNLAGSEVVKGLQAKNATLEQEVGKLKDQLKELLEKGVEKKEGADDNKFKSGEKEGEGEDEVFDLVKYFEEQSKN